MHFLNKKGMRSIFVEMFFCLTSIKCIKTRTLALEKTIINNLFDLMLHFHFRAYLRDVVEMCHIFCKIMENFCKGGVVVQKKNTKRKKGSSKRSKAAAAPKQKENVSTTFFSTKQTHV